MRLMLKKLDLKLALSSMLKLNLLINVLNKA